MPLSQLRDRLADRRLYEEREKLPLHFGSSVQVPF